MLSLTARSRTRPGHAPSRRIQETVSLALLVAPFGPTSVPALCSLGAGHRRALCLVGQPRGLLYPAELHTDGALPPFSRASSPQKLASPTFQVPFWYTATPD